MIVDGKALAHTIFEDLARQRAEFPPVVRLGVLLSDGDKATESFVKIKEKVADRLQVVVVREVVDEGATTAQALAAVDRLTKSCEGVVVQLPLPKNIHIEDVLQALLPGKDVDALGPDPFVAAPVALAVQEILERSSVEVVGKKAVVVGEGRLVGKPVAQMLEKLGANVVVVSLEQGSLAELKDADIVVSGAGSPNLITPEMLKVGAVLIDAGTSEHAGRVVGDCNMACAEVASVFTPVPGGVGPVAVAMLFKNLFSLAPRR